MRHRCVFFGCGDVFSAPFRDALCRWQVLAGPQETADLAVIASHGRILSDAELQKFDQGVINMHPSMLPRFRGAAPAEWQILRGERQGGVTALLTTSRVDAGPILAQKAFSLTEDETRDSLLRKAADEGVLLLEKLLLDWKTARQNAVPQNKDLASSAPKVSRALSVVNWQEWTPVDVDRRVRALAQRFGGLHTNFGAKSIRLLPENLRCKEQRTDASMRQLQPGQIEWRPGTQFLRVGLGERYEMLISSLSVAGARSMSASDFARGYHQKQIETRFT